MRVIYIAGASHSGSTLLDMMLNAHPEIVSLGEVYKLHQKLAPRKLRTKAYARCSCGAESLLRCPFWSKVNALTLKAANKSLSELDLEDYRDLDGRTAPNAVVFRAVAEAAQESFVVDSSKSPRRLSYLMQVKGLDVYPIHLIRDPKGQICSALRKRSNFFKSLLHYEIVHEQLRRRLKSVPHTVVRYEDLVREPERTLRSVLEPLGLEFDPRQLQWAEQEKHLVAGNSIRRGTTSKLVLDERWKESLSPRQKLLIELGTRRSRGLAPATGTYLRAEE
jgi:hypothetical protein